MTVPFVRQRYFSRLTAIISVVIFTTVFGYAQQRSHATKSPSSKPKPVPFSQNLDKYPGLLEEFGKLLTRFQSEVQLPAERNQSQLLPLMPGSTVAYLGAANYGASLQQVLAIFRQELGASLPLREWWQEGEMAKDGPKFEDAIEKAYRVSEFLGDEIAVSAAMSGKEPSLLILAEVKRPGLKTYLQSIFREKGVVGDSTPNTIVVDAEELSALRESDTAKKLIVLVRPDYVVAASELSTLHSFNARLKPSGGEFASTPFGERVRQAYGSGISTIGAVDVAKILAAIPSKADKDRRTLQLLGFDNAKYAVWERKSVAGRSVSEAELSFSGPRHGVVSWLAPPSPMGSLEFVSPKAVMVAGLKLKDPAQIFDELRELATASNPRSFASFDQMQNGLGLDIKNEIISQLSGEITLEVDNVTPPFPAWKAILQVKDADRLQQALSQLLRATPFRAEEYEQEGITHHVIRIPTPKGNAGWAYAFVDGYLIIGTTPEMIGEAAKLHRDGGSLAKSSQFLTAMPSGHSSGASVMFYQDPLAMAALQMKQFAPAMAERFSSMQTSRTPSIVCLYADGDAIREASSSSTVDVGTVLVVAAIAIPNLLRSRMAANEASAVGSMRTINTAEAVYASTYSDRGFAPDLATLGPGPGKHLEYTAEHAGLVDVSLGAPECTMSNWCTKSGYRFAIKGICVAGECRQYVAAATPVTSSTGMKNFCSTSDGIVRMKPGLTLTAIPSVPECRSWTPLQ